MQLCVTHKLFTQTVHTHKGSTDQYYTTAGVSQGRQIKARLTHVGLKL